MQVLRLINKGKKEKEEQELRIELTRSFMALFANANRDSKKYPAPFMPQDFWHLSYDMVEEQRDPSLLFNAVVKKLGSTIKGKDNGN